MDSVVALQHSIAKMQVTEHSLYPRCAEAKSVSPLQLGSPVENAAVSFDAVSRPPKSCIRLTVCITQLPGWYARRLGTCTGSMCICRGSKESMGQNMVQRRTCRVASKLRSKVGARKRHNKSRARVWRMLASLDAAKIATLYRRCEPGSEVCPPTSLVFSLGVKNFLRDVQTAALRSGYSERNTS